MKYTNKNNQIQPHLFGFWINNNLHDGIIIKKKIVSNNSIKNKNKDDKDGIYVRLLYLCYMIFKITFSY